MKHPIERFISFALIAGLIFAFYLWVSTYRTIKSTPQNEQAKIYFLDVGQADATLISLPNSLQILIDGGRDSRAASELSRYMSPFDKKIEFVIATHPDADHIGGLDEVLQSYEIGEFIKSKAQSEAQTYETLLRDLKAKNVPVKEVSQSDKINFSDLSQIIFFWPKDKEVSSLSSNNGSLVFRFDFRLGRVLFTGDAEVEAQNKILSSVEASELKSDLYKVPHHGAESALNKKFLKVVEPKEAVISVGKNNSYGHPAKTVLEALQELSIQIFRTDELGTIEFDYQNESWIKAN